MMHQTRRIPIVQLNEYLTCKLCKGYFIDATTIIECLHTFCRSCIVRYLEKNKYCPICDVQVHKTKPLLNIRPDKALQDIVYKLVPRLFQNEMCRRREFYSSHPDARPSNLEQCGEASYQHILSPDETICLSLNYHGSTGPPRYLCCPAAVSVVHLQKLLRAKYDLMDRHRVDILHNQDSLNSHLTLMDIAYIYLWRRKGPLELTYRIYEMTTKKLTEDIPNPSGVENGDSCTNSAAEDKKNEWKEVQLTISESGEMCITGVDDGVLVKEEDAENCNVSMEVSDSKTPNNCADKHLLKTEDSSVSDSNTRIDSDVVKSDSDTQSAISETIAQSVGSADKIDNDQEGTKASKNNTLLPSSTHSDALVLTETVTTTKDAPAVSISSTVSTSTVHVTPKCSTSVSNNVLTSGSGSSTSCTTTLSTSSVSLLVSTNTSTFTTESSTSSVWTTSSGASRMTKHKLEDKSDGEPAVKQAKPSNLSQLYNLSNNHPLKKHSQTVRSKDPPDAKSSLPMSLLCPISATSALSITNCVAAPLTTCAASIKLSPPPYKPQLCYTPKTNYNPVINIPKVLVSTSLAKAEPKATSSTLVTTLTPPPINAKTHIKMKSSSPVGYKTLRDPPKTWNPQISRTSLMKSSPDPKCADLKNARPAKFFKLRNNMPRYLGNPASGVKPLYHVHTGPDKEKPETSGKSEKMEIKKHSIVKIDPKTLKPISEKAPETSSLSTPTPDLKINTSSVPIFNPLKLQSSPKNDRKSPKSPQPPRTKTNSPPNKNNKLNLNYTPPNPFVPNLASPTMNPNQFHFPGPPGFPTYDPRIIAAYQHLFYGQSVLYPPNSLSGMSSVDLNQRKNFDIPGPTSPKVPALPVSQSRHRTSPKNSESSNSKLLNDCNTVTILNPLASTNAAKLPKLPEPSRPSDNSLASSSGSGPKILNTKASLAKRPIKESGKGEKSLQTAVEKLTQNRVKMLNKVEAVNIKKEELPLPVKLEVNGKHDDVASSPLRNGTPKEVKEKANSVLFEPKVEEASIKLEINHVDSTDVKNLPSATNDKNLAASNNNNTDSVPLVTDTNK